MEGSDTERPHAGPSAPVLPKKRGPGRPRKSAGGGGGSGSSSSSSSSDSSSSSGSSDSSDSSSSDDEEAEPVAPITDARMVSLPLAKINPSFTCKLCGGYLRDAHTLRDCLHTFCRACLERYIVNTRRNDVVHCPYRAETGCTTALIATHPMRTEVRYDRAMQNLIDKLLPQFVAQEEELKKQIEAQFGGGTSEAKRKAAALAAQSKANTASAAAAASDSTAIEPVAKKAKFGDEKFGHDKLMIFELRPYVAPAGAPPPPASVASLPPLGPLDQPFVKTSAKVTVKHLRKFILERLGLPATGAGAVNLDLMCSGEVLGQDHSIEFIWRTRWCHLHPNQHLVLTYRYSTLF